MYDPNKDGDIGSYIQWLQKKKKKKKSLKLGIASAIFLLIIIIGLITAMDAKQLKKDASFMKSSLQTSVKLIKDGEPEEAKVQIEKTKETTAKLEKKLDSPLWKMHSFLPVVGKQIRSVRQLLSIVDDASDTILTPAADVFAEYPLSSIKVGDSGFNVRAVGSYISFAEGVMPEARTIAKQVSKMNLSLVDKDGKFKEYQEKFAKIDEQYDEISDLLPVLKVICGDEADHLYVLTAANTSEMRPLGGFVGSVGTIQITDGVLTIGDFKTVYDCFYKDTPDSLGITMQERNLFNDKLYVTWDANYTPDFGRAAEIMASGYEMYNDVQVDGVISFTPTIVQKVLAMSGPITLSDGTEVDGTNAARVIERDLYFKYFNNRSFSTRNAKYADQLFSETAKKAMSMFVSGFDAKNIMAYYNLFASCVEDRSMYIWMRDEAEQNVMISSGVSGVINNGIPDATSGVYLGFYHGQKLGYFIDIETSVSEPTVNQDGSRTYTVNVLLRNTSTDEELKDVTNEYVTGEYELTEGSLYVTAPVGGVISDFTMSDGSQTAVTDYMDISMGYNLDINLYRDSEILATYNVTTAPGIDAPLKVHHTPTLTEYR